MGFQVWEAKISNVNIRRGCSYFQPQPCTMGVLWRMKARYNLAASHYITAKRGSDRQQFYQRSLWLHVELLTRPFNQAIHFRLSCRINQHYTTPRQTVHGYDIVISDLVPVLVSAFATTFEFWINSALVAALHNGAIVLHSNCSFKMYFTPVVSWVALMVYL